MLASRRKDFFKKEVIILSKLKLGARKMPEVVPVSDIVIAAP